MLRAAWLRPRLETAPPERLLGSCSRLIVRDDRSYYTVGCLTAQVVRRRTELRRLWAEGSCAAHALKSAAPRTRGLKSRDSQDIPVRPYEDRRITPNCVKRLADSYGLPQVPYSAGLRFLQRALPVGGDYPAVDHAVIWGMPPLVDDVVSYRSCAT
jgi:hypothetical protein